MPPEAQVLICPRCSEPVLDDLWLVAGKYYCSQACAFHVVGTRPSPTWAELEGGAS